MAKAYLDVVKSDGDVRILLLNGELLGAMRRRPREGDFRTNIHAVEKAYKHEIPMPRVMLGITVCICSMR
jgi:glutathione synthase